MFICRVDSWIRFMSFAGLYCLCDLHHIDFGVYVFLCVSHVFNRNGVYVLFYMEFLYMVFMYWVTVKRLCLRLIGISRNLACCCNSFVVILSICGLSKVRFWVVWDCVGCF